LYLDASLSTRLRWREQDLAEGMRKRGGDEGKDQRGGKHKNWVDRRVGEARKGDGGSGKIQNWPFSFTGRGR